MQSAKFLIQPTYPCKNKICTLVKDMAAKELASVFQFHPCINKDNGCTEKMILENLLGHEASCLLRNILCPFKGKDGCTDPEKIIFGQLMDHLNQKHSPVIKFEEKLEYVGTIDELESKTYVLESYSRLFTPIFFRSSELFFIGVFLHGEEIEASQFKAHIKFTNDDYTTFGASQKVKSVDDQEDLGHFFILRQTI